jgi:predicted DNA-binding transcriptional regulator AlpA
MHYLSFSQLQAKLGNRSRSSVYRDLEAGRLPRPVKLGSRLYWREDEIDATLAALAEEAQE